MKHPILLARACVKFAQKRMFPAGTITILSTAPGVLGLVFQDLLSKGALVGLFGFAALVAGVSLWHNLRFYSEQHIDDDKSGGRDDGITRLPAGLFDDQENKPWLSWDDVDVTKKK